MAKDKNTAYNQIANFVYETGIHSKTPRSGFWFLGSGEQSVAEHLFHTAMIAYTLAHLEPKADKNKMILRTFIRTHILSKKPVVRFFENWLGMVLAKVLGAEGTHTIRNNLLHQLLLLRSACI